MKIRKLFKFEASHIVRNCYSEKCKFSTHGHSYLVEVFLESDGFDNAMMVYDFGLLKPLKQFFNYFDHSIMLWDKDDWQYKNAMKQFSERWIEMPVNPTAEAMALLVNHGLELILII